MVLFECSRPFQPPSYTRFGAFRRVMVAWFAVTYFDGGINELIESIADAGVRLHQEEKQK